MSSIPFGITGAVVGHIIMGMNLSVKLGGDTSFDIFPNGWDKTFALNGEKLFENVKTTLEKNWKDFKEILNQKNLARKDCLLLPLRAVLKALKI